MEKVSILRQTRFVNWNLCKQISQNFHKYLDLLIHRLQICQIFQDKSNQSSTIQKFPHYHSNYTQKQQNSTQTSPWYHLDTTLDITQILLKKHPNTTQVLPKFIKQISTKFLYCTYITQILLRYHQNIAQISPICYLDITQTTPKHHPNIN